MVTYGSHVMVTQFVLSYELVCTAHGDTMLLVVDYTPRASPRTALGSNGHLCVVTERILGCVLMWSARRCSCYLCTMHTHTLGHRREVGNW